MDTKMALGLARSEARDLKKSVDGKVLEFHQTIHGMLRKRFGVGRRQSLSEMRSLVAEADRLIGTDMRPVVRHAVCRPATRARPKSGASERLSLHVIPTDHPAGTLYELWGFRMHASARRVVVEVLETGMRFHLHTVQRLIERSDDDFGAGRMAAGTATIEIGKALSLQSGMLFAALEISKSRRQDMTVAFPFGTGMLIGTIEAQTALSQDRMPVFERHVHDSIGYARKQEDHPFLGKFACPSEAGTFRKITMRTYVPGLFMRREQSEFTDRWEDIRLAHPCLDAWRNARTWPNHEMWKSVPVDQDAVKAALAAVETLITDRVFQNSRPRRIGSHVFPAPPLVATVPEMPVIDMAMQAMAM